MGSVGCTVAAGVFAVLGIGCVGVGVDDYEGFRSAVDSGATCAQLVDIADNFEDRPALRERMNEDLEDIGCSDPDPERTDR